MPAERKVFRTKTSDALPTEPFDVELENAAGETKTLTFNVYTDPPAGALLTMAKMIRVNDQGQEFMDPSLLGQAFEDAIIVADRERWTTEVVGTSTGWMVPSGVLGEIFEWLQSEVWERPTVPSSGSSDSHSVTGAGSTVNPPFAAPTSPISSTATPTAS